MKRSARKKRRVTQSSYTDPGVYRDVLSLIAPHCDVQTFARLKRVCKRFREWLPAHHPLREEIVKEYAKEHPREHPEIVDVIGKAYFRRFMGMIHPRIHCRVVTHQEWGGGTERDGFVRCNLHTGVIYVSEFVISHIFEDNPCAMLEFNGNMNVDCKEVICGQLIPFRNWSKPKYGLQRLVLPYAVNAKFYFPLKEASSLYFWFIIPHARTLHPFTYFLLKAIRAYALDGLETPDGGRHSILLCISRFPPNIIRFFEKIMFVHLRNDNWVPDVQQHFHQRRIFSFQIPVVVVCQRRPPY